MGDARPGRPAYLKPVLGFRHSLLRLQQAQRSRPEDRRLRRREDRRWPYAHQGQACNLQHDSERTMSDTGVPNRSDATCGSLNPSDVSTVNATSSRELMAMVAM